jgi:hypothetical protein
MAVGEQVPGIDLEGLAPWFSEHVAPVELHRRLKSAAW